jgi:hypothetical protein
MFPEKANGGKEPPARGVRGKRTQYPAKACRIPHKDVWFLPYRNNMEFWKFLQSLQSAQ